MNVIWDNVLAQPIFMALIFGAAAYVFSRVFPLIGKVLALAAGGWVIALGARAVSCAPAEFPSLLQFNLGKVVLNVQFSVTYLGSLVAIGAAVFTILVAVYSFRLMAREYWEGKFYAYLIWAMAGACIVGWAANFFVLLIGWELVTLMLFLMINQGRAGSQNGAAKTYAMLGFADACLLMAIVLMFSLPTVPGKALHNLAIPITHSPVSLSDTGWLGYTIYGLLLIAAFAKAGAIPLHTWIPAAAADAPVSVMAYLPAAVDKLLGIYLLARVSLDLFRPDATMQVVLMSIGAVTIISAVFMAMIQHNLKRLLAFHSVSQVGYMVLGIGTGTAVGIIGGLFHMVNNAIYKSNLFLMSGVVGKAAGTDEIEDMGGLARRLPITFICGVISAAAISGVPPFNGFVSKWLVYQGALSLHSGFGTAVLVAAVFGSALTLASFVKVLYSAFLSRPPADARMSEGEGESFWTALPMIVLAGACIVLGLYPQLITGKVLTPGIVPWKVGVPGAIEYLGGTLMTGGVGVWNPIVALGLILIGIIGGLILLGIGKVGQKVRIVRPFLAGEIGLTPSGELDDRFRFPGTGFYETVSRLPVLRTLLSHGQRGAMDPYHWSGRFGSTIVSLLRAQHTGLICLYVAWCIIGFVTVVIYLMIASGVH